VFTFHLSPFSLLFLQAGQLHAILTGQRADSASIGVEIWNIETETQLPFTIPTGIIPHCCVVLNKLSHDDSINGNLLVIAGADSHGQNLLLSVGIGSSEAVLVSSITLPSSVSAHFTYLSLQHDRLCLGMSSGDVFIHDAASPSLDQLVAVQGSGAGRKQQTIFFFFLHFDSDVIVIKLLHIKPQLEITSLNYICPFQLLGYSSLRRIPLRRCLAWLFAAKLKLRITSFPRCCSRLPYPQV
jgi:hypothetical protein